MGFDTETGGLLSDAGYSAGDLLGSYTAQSAATNSTTSSSYVAWNPDPAGIHLEFNTAFPGSSQAQAIAFLDVDPSTDQIDVRLFNLDDDETVVEQTGITSAGSVVLGPTDYTPASPNAVNRMLIQLRNSDNTTSVSINFGTQAYVPKL